MKRPARASVEAAIRGAGGNLSRTASQLGCTRQTLYTWIYQYGLDRLAGVVPLEAVRAPAENGAGPRPLTVKLPAPLHRWARIRAIDTERTVGAVVAEALELLKAVAERVGEP